MSDGVWLPQEEFDELVAWKNRHLAESRLAESVLADGIEELGMSLLESRDRVRDVLAAVGVTIQQQLRLDQERIAELELELANVERERDEKATDLAGHAHLLAEADQTIECLLANVRPLLAELKVIIDERLLPPTSEMELTARLVQAARTISGLNVSAQFHRNKREELVKALRLIRDGRCKCGGRIKWKDNQLRCEQCNGRFDSNAREIATEALAQLDDPDPPK